MNAPKTGIQHNGVSASGSADACARGAIIVAVLGLLSLALPQSPRAYAAATSGPASADVLRFRVVGDGVPDALDAAAGDASRGRALIVARESANCVLCHAISDPAMRFSGNVGPSLDGIGRRLTAAQLRLRVADSLRLNAKTIMPSYYRVDGLDRVASAYRGKPVLDARQVEDIVAYLVTLR